MEVAIRSGWDVLRQWRYPTQNIFFCTIKPRCNGGARAERKMEMIMCWNVAQNNLDCLELSFLWMLFLSLFVIFTKLEAERFHDVFTYFRQLYVDKQLLNRSGMLFCKKLTASFNVAWFLIKFWFFDFFTFYPNKKSFCHLPSTGRFKPLRYFKASSTKASDTVFPITSLADWKGLKLEKFKCPYSPQNVGWIGTSIFSKYLKILKIFKKYKNA